MQIPFYQVDAFTSRVFGGNPAAVCLLDEWFSGDLLQSIAAENNLSETAFLVPRSPGRFDLRWFTPAVEIDLCGHATLASAFVVFKSVDTALERVEFDTASGILTVARFGDLLTLDFPSRAPVQHEPSALLSEALGAEPDSVWKARDIMAVFEDETVVRSLKPDFLKLRAMEDIHGFIVTAPAARYDFVSRFFAPGVGIDEDPVTGSAHCTLVPYWAGRLGKSRLHAYQASKRGGELLCEHAGSRVRMSGSAALYAKGEIII